MRRLLISLLTLILCGWGQGAMAQTGIADMEQYNSYELRGYIDNLLQGISSDVFTDVYYSRLKQSDYKGTLSIISSSKVREVRTRSKKAGSGYLFVNDCVSTFAGTLDRDPEGLKVSYVLNGRQVLTKKDVDKVLRLREKRIRVTRIAFDNLSGIITVYLDTP